MAVEGSLDLFRLPEILQMVSQQGKTGILTIQGQQDIVAVSFLKGRIVAADSLAHTVEDGLAKVLVTEGLMSGADFARAGAENQATGGRLLDHLVDRGYLSRRQLLAALRLQTLRQLEALLRWQEGDFKFYGGDEVSYEEGFESISVEDLLLRSLGDFSAAPPAPLAPSAPPRPPAGGARRRDEEDLLLAEVPELPDVAPPIDPSRGAGPRPVARPSRSAPPIGMPPPGDRLSGVSGSPGSAAPPPPRSPLASPSALASPASGVAGPSGSSGSAGSVGAGAGDPAAGEPAPWPASIMASVSAIAAATSARGAGEAAAAAAAAGSGLRLPPAAPLSGGGGTGAAAGTSRARPAVAGGIGGGVRPSGLPPAIEPLVPPPGLAGPSGVAGGAGAGAGGTAAAPALPRKFRQMQIERPERGTARAHRLSAAAMALGLVALLVLVARRSPVSLPLPFPWQGGERNEMVGTQRETLFEKVDRAARTAFLRDGRFPDSLEQLRDSGLLAAGDLFDPRGGPLRYSASEDSYTLRAAEDGKPLVDSEVTKSVTGNFLLDPALTQGSTTAGPPIVLLD